MTGSDAIDPTDRVDQRLNSPALTVITGLTYSEPAQMFKHWFLPAYQIAFRWTGNRADAEDATTWVFKTSVGRMPLPELVSVIDQHIADATLEAASRHWSDRYGIDPLRCAEIFAREASSHRPANSLEMLLGGVSAELRLLIVLRFLRKRSLPAIAAQLDAPAGNANVRLFKALLQVAERMGLDAGRGDLVQADQVATYVDHLIDKRRPPRFEAMPATWAALLAAAHVQAAVAGNNLPRVRFVRSLQETLKTRENTGNVTRMRIWSA